MLENLEMNFNFLGNMFRSFESKHLSQPADVKVQIRAMEVI